MHKQLKKFLRRFPQRISLTTLMIVVAFAAVASYYIAPFFNTPREYPYLTIGKMQDEQFEYPMRQMFVITVRYQQERKGSEYYADYAPWGTVNHAIDCYGDSRSSYYHEEWIGTAQEGSTQKVSDVDQARYNSLLKYVQQQVNVDQQSWGWRQTFLLPADYPTFAEFERSYRLQTPQRNAPPIAARGNAATAQAGACGCD